MEDNMVINVYSTNKQSLNEICKKCIEHLGEDENKNVKLIAKSNGVPKAISVSEMVKNKIPNVIQKYQLINLNDQSKNRRRNIEIIINLKIKNGSKQPICLQ